MKIPKVFRPILGLMIGAILFLVGIAILSATFVLAYEFAAFAKPYVTEVFTDIIHHLATLLPL